MKNCTPRSSSVLCLAFNPDQRIFPALEFMGYLKTEHSKHCLWSKADLKRPFSQLCICEKWKNSSLGHSQALQAQFILERQDIAVALLLARDTTQDSIAPCYSEAVDWWGTTQTVQCGNPTLVSLQVLGQLSLSGVERGIVNTDSQRCSHCLLWKRRAGQGNVRAEKMQKWTKLQIFQ